jgi:RNA polymerase sigma factor (sigma-70 family)
MDAGRGNYLSAMPSDDSTASRADSTAHAIDWRAEFDRHRRWLRMVALARVGDASAADDVMQEVSVTALEKGHQLRDPTRVAGWLYRLVVVAALQFRRRQGRRKKLLDRYALREPSADGVARERDPLGWLLADERKAMVHQALKTLPPRDAEIMFLKYSEDWSYQQLAEHLGLSVSAVEARLHRARQKMRQQLCKLDPSLKSNK